MSKTSRKSVASALAAKSLSGGISKKFSLGIAAYLLAERRTNELDPLMRDIQSLWAEQGYVNALAVTAHPINDAARKQMRRTVASAYPKAKTILISEQHDPEVIGGVRIELADRQLDATIVTKLNKFKQLTTGKD